MKKRNEWRRDIDVVGSGNSRSIRFFGLEVFKVVYNPENFFKAGIRQYETLNPSPAWKDQQIIATTIDKYKQEKNIDLTREEAEKIMSDYEKWFAEAKAHRMSKYIEEELGSIIGEMLSRAEREAQMIAASEYYDRPISAERAREVLDPYWEFEKDRLGIAGPGGPTRTKHHWTDKQRANFTEHYESLHKIWREVRRLYKKVCQLKQWPMIIKGEYPVLPDDLISYLCDPDPYMWSAANLAIEHAARCVGIPPFLYTPRQLRTYLLKADSKIEKSIGRNSRKKMKHKSENEVP